MPPSQIKRLKPAPFAPTTSFAGDEVPLIVAGENQWLRFGRFGTIKSESYGGSVNLSETIATKVLTGRLTWSSTSKTVTGVNTLFIDELHLGSFVFIDNGASNTDCFVVEKIVSNTSFITSRIPQATTVTKTFLDANVNTGTEEITIATHGFTANQQVYLSNSGGALPTGLSATTLYYVLVVNANTIQLSLTSGGAAVDITAAAGGGTHTVGYASHVLPVLFPLGSDRGTLVRGNAVQFPKGHILAVGDGTLRINGTALNATLAASRTPRFALYDPTAGTYTQDDVGIAKILTPPTLAAGATGDRTLTNATNATPIVCTTAAAHRLHTGQQITISGVTGNTAANGTFYIKKNTSTTFSLYSDANLTVPVAGNGAYIGGGTISLPASNMRAGDYSIRVSAYNSKTLGYSQPSDIPGTPVTLTAGQLMSITFNTAMATDQDGYIIWGTEYADNATAQIEKRYMGPWYEVARITKKDLIDDAHPLGSETGTVYEFNYADGEIASVGNLISFNNFTPVEAEYVDLINGIPLYFSCLGKGTTTKASSTPGPACVPSKPSNPEAVFLNKAITTAGGDYILGVQNYKARIYALCQNSLQTLVLTTLDDEPITFRSLWTSGFRNPYNVAFVKEYLYGFGTQGIVRSVAGGDDSAMEFEFASDVKDYVDGWAPGHVLVGYDPKNRAVCFFYTAAERRSGYQVTICLPFLLDKQVWNPPIILNSTTSDFIVSGVATIGNSLTFLAGGRTNAGVVAVGTYRFDSSAETATESEVTADEDWYLSWNYSDDGQEINAKTITGLAVTGHFEQGATVKLYGVKPQGTIDFSLLSSGSSASKTFTIPVTSGLSRSGFKLVDWGPYSLYAIRIEGTGNADRLDEIVLQYEVNSSEQ
jgi:hypothetical protein